MSPFSVVAEAAALETTDASSIESVITVIKSAVSGVFDIATSAFDFLLSTPLCAFMVGSGFAFTGLSLVRKALRTGKRA